MVSHQLVSGDPQDGSTVGFELEKRTYRVADLSEVGLGYDAAVGTRKAETEFKRSVFEMVTGVLRPDSLWDTARSMRRVGSEIAASQHCLPLDSSLPLNIMGVNAISPEQRYSLQSHRARGLGDPSPTGMHIHINVHDLDRRVEVRDRLSAYEHVLIAITGASPFDGGVFRRVASMRTEYFGMLPTVFDPDWTGSYAAHLGLLKKHLQVADYWGRYAEPDVYRFAHPRTRVSTDGKPTVEIRTPEMPLTLDDLMLTLYVSIGLTNRIIADIELGLPAVARRDVGIEHPVMRKHASIFGLGHTLHHPESGRLKPAWNVVDDLAQYIEPGLFRYDPSGVANAHVRRLLAGLRRHGTGAQRLVKLHDSIYQARLDRGLPVVDYQRWLAGAVPMSRGTARDLVANVMLLNLFGDLTGSDAGEVARMAYGFAGNGGDAFEVATAKLLERHGHRLERGFSFLRNDQNIPWASRGMATGNAEEFFAP